jgi:hypothetical protein
LIWGRAVCRLPINLGVIMVRLPGKLIAVPVRLLAELLSIVPIFDPVALWSVCWKFGRNVEDGCKLLMLQCRKDGIDRARRTGQEMMEETRNCEVAATMGLLEWSQGQGFQGADRWVKAAREAGFDKPETLLYLELVLGEYLEEYDKEAIAEQILSRNDLPALYTLAALAAKANTYLSEQQWDQAESIADRLLVVQEQPDARITKWVVCTARGEHAEAERNLAKARGKMADEILGIVVAQGWLYLGRTDKAMESLYGADYRRVQWSRFPTGQLVRSDEFHRYCSERENR